MRGRWDIQAEFLEGGISMRAAWYQRMLLSSYHRQYHERTKHHYIFQRATKWTQAALLLTWLVAASKLAAVWACSLGHHPLSSQTTIDAIDAIESY